MLSINFMAQFNITNTGALNNFSQEFCNKKNGYRERRQQRGCAGMLVQRADCLVAKSGIVIECCLRLTVEEIECIVNLSKHDPS
jgi:hypothetical protein